MFVVKVELREGGVVWSKNDPDGFLSKRLSRAYADGYKALVYHGKDIDDAINKDAQSGMEQQAYRPRKESSAGFLYVLIDYGEDVLIAMRVRSGLISAWILRIVEICDVEIVTEFLYSLIGRVDGHTNVDGTGLRGRIDMDLCLKERGQVD